MRWDALVTSMQFRQQKSYFFAALLLFVVLTSLIALLIASGGLTSKSSGQKVASPHDSASAAQVVAQGEFAGSNWAVSIYRQTQTNQRCMVSSSYLGDNGSESKSCEPDRWRGGWSFPKVVLAGPREDHAAVLFFFLRPGTGFIRVQIERSGSNGKRWFTVDGQLVNSKTSQAAGFNRPVVFGTAQSRDILQRWDSVCVRRVNVFAPNGRLLERSGLIYCQ